MNIESKKIAIIGFGSQGYGQGMNLVDSGCDVVFGLRKGRQSWMKAKDYGLKVMEIAEADRPVVELAGVDAADSNWVGFGDASDVKLLDIQTSGKYIFSLEGVAATHNALAYAEDALKLKR